MLCSGAECRGISVYSLSVVWNVFVSAFLDAGNGSAAFQTGLDYVKFLSFFTRFIGLKASSRRTLRGAGDVKAFTVANLVNLSIRVIVTNVFAPV